MTSTMRQVIEHKGQRYHCVAGPFRDQFDAYDYIDALYELGEIDDSDDPIVEGTSVYLRTPGQEDS
jgi:hypothetical protein